MGAVVCWVGVASPAIVLRRCAAPLPVAVLGAVIGWVTVTIATVVEYCHSVQIPFTIHYGFGPGTDGAGGDVVFSGYVRINRVGAPLVLAFAPVGGAFMNRRVSNQRLMVSASIVDRPAFARVFTHLPNHINERLAQKKTNGVVAIERDQRRADPTDSRECRAGVQVADVENALWLNLVARKRTQRLHHLPITAVHGFSQRVMLEGNGLIGAVVNFDELVVARTVHVLRNERSRTGVLQAMGSGAPRRN